MPLKGLLIGPASGLAVGLHLEPLLELMGASADDAILQEDLDLFLSERISLDRGGVMRLLDPDVGPDVMKDRRLGKTADDEQVLSRLIQRFEDFFPAGAAYWHVLSRPSVTN